MVGPLIRFDQSELEKAIKSILQHVDTTNLFLKKHVPKMSKRVVLNSKKIKDVETKIPEHEKFMKTLQKELEDLTTVWSQEEEKTSNM